MTAELEGSRSPLAHTIRSVGLLAGPLAALVVYAAATPSEAAGLTEPGRRVLAVGAWMAAWWLSEALPISVTALLPLILFPLLRVMDIRDTAAPYADNVIFLFFGGFVLGEGLRSSGLHTRVALSTLLGVGTTPRRIVGGVMLATALLSMWVSNTATTLMMLPIGMSIVALVEKSVGTEEGKRAGWTEAAVKHLSIAIVLGIAYSASIAGMGTPIGSPPNVIMLNFAKRNLDVDVGFVRWMLMAMPIVVVFLVLAWAMLVFVLHPVKAGRVAGGREMLKAELGKLGPMRKAEWVTLGVFVATAALWVSRSWLTQVEIAGWGKPLSMLSDAGIAVLAALLLFLIPIDLRTRRGVVTLAEVERAPWSILLLFGGGLSLASAMGKTGVDAYLGGLFGGLAGLPLVVVLAVLVSAIVFGGELASNAAVVTAMMPVLVAAAPEMKLDPLPLMFAATLAASCGFMLPVATPPNALAYATKRVTQSQMVRAGLGLDLIGIVLIVVAMALVGGRMMGSG